LYDRYMAEESGVLENDIINHRVTYAGRTVPPPPDIEGFNAVLKERSRMVTSGRLATLAMEWERASANFYLHTYGQDHDVYASELWDEKAMRAYDNFRVLVKKTPVFLRETDGEDGEGERQRRDNYNAIGEYIQDPTFPARTALVKLIHYDLLMEKPDSGEDEGSKQRRDDFLEKKALARPVLEAALRTATTQRDRATVEEVFDGYFNIGDEAEAKSILCMPGLNVDQRLQVAVGYSNTFGFISAIDVISRQAKTTRDEALRIQYEDVYRKMQGETVTQIMSDLSDVYGAITFDTYALSTETLTRAEADLLEETVREVSHQKGIPPEDVTILDLGAGTGRLTKELIRRERTVVAVEYEPHHAEKIRKEAPSATVIQGSWHDLEALMKGKHIDIIASVMRSLGHNRTAGEWLHAFDECRVVVDPETGRVLFDEPNMELGGYRTRIQHLATNLRQIGIRDVSENDIFDGPDQEHKFNRKFLRPEQVDAIARFLGFRRNIKITEERTESDVPDNIYYELEVDPHFDPGDISMEELSRNAEKLGLYSPGTDFNMFVKSWGMTIGQALTFGLNDNEVRRLNELGRPPMVHITVLGDHIQFKGSFS
jgi:SAM-dependent methyltransferase